MIDTGDTSTWPAWNAPYDDPRSVGPIWLAEEWVHALAPETRSADPTRRRHALTSLDAALYSLYLPRSDALSGGPQRLESLGSKLCHLAADRLDDPDQRVRGVARRILRRYVADAGPALLSALPRLTGATARAADALAQAAGLDLLTRMAVVADGEEV